MKMLREWPLGLTAISLWLTLSLSGCFNPRYRLNNKGLHGTISLSEVVITELAVPLDSTAGMRAWDFPEHFYGSDYLHIESKSQQHARHIFFHEENPALTMIGEKAGAHIEVSSPDAFLVPGKNYLISGLTRYDRPALIILFEYGADGRVKRVWLRV